MKPMSTFHLFTKMLRSLLMVYCPYEKQAPFYVHSYISISKHKRLLFSLCIPASYSEVSRFN